MKRAGITDKTIQSRLILLSSVVLFLLILSLFSMFLQNQTIMAKYARMAEYQQLVSRIYLQVTNTSEALEDYLESKTPEDLRKYKIAYSGLLEDAHTYSQIERNPKNRRIALDFRYMIQTFVEEATRSVQYQQGRDLVESTRSYVEARKIQALINAYLPEIVSVQNADVELIDREANQARKDSLIASGLILIFVAMFVVIYSRRIISGITRPVAKLLKSAKAVSKGKWETRVEPIESSREMKMVADAINEMLDMIQRQIVELNEARKHERESYHSTLESHRLAAALKEAQLKTLQARINPHFLFNTLNAITQTAYLEESRKTAEITESFASLMRFNLDHFGGEVSLSEEFTNLKDYMFLQRNRFENRIKMNCKMDGEIGSAHLPGLVLQPLVENSISHGMESTEKGGEIHVKAESRGDHFIISVKDNGKGMSRSAVEHFNEYAKGIFPKEYGNEVGLRSVMERLSLYFDGHVDFEVETAEGRGTEIRITLPRELDS